MSAEQIECLIVGAGPAGLAAAEILHSAGKQVVICEAKPSVARKFLMAGKSGLNLTNAGPDDQVLDAFGAASPLMRPMLAQFGAGDVAAWAVGLGEPLFTGSSGRVFPQAMKASPLLRKWLQRLDGVQIRTRWRWTGWHPDGLCFETPEGMREIRAVATVLAVGGASWPRLGSDGAWTDWFGFGPLYPFRPANMGLEIAWSDHLRSRFAGAAVKGAALSIGAIRSRGEFVITPYGVEGGAVYSVSAAARDALAVGPTHLQVDLFPDQGVEEIAAKLSRKRGKASLSNHLRKTLGLTGSRAALLNEAGPFDPARLKALAFPLTGARPVAEAISSAGGLGWQALDGDLMLRDRPGTFAAGEMLDWEAPTGGYLLTGCLSTGRWAGQGAVRWLERRGA